MSSNPDAQFQSTPRVGARGDGWHSTFELTDSQFQSTPRVGARGDKTADVKGQTSTLFQSTPRVGARGDMAWVSNVSGFIGFNPHLELVLEVTLASRTTS